MKDNFEDSMTKVSKYYLYNAYVGNITAIKAGIMPDTIFE